MTQEYAIPPTLSENFLNSVMVTLIARATILSIPFIGSILLYAANNIYGGIQKALEVNAAQIQQIQNELQDHQFRLENGKAARLEFQTNTERQFARLDTQLADIASKIALVNNTVIRVQTIIETRLPTKEGALRLPAQE